MAEKFKMFTCMCRKSFVGYKKDFLAHLKNDCVVYANAKRTLEEARALLKPIK